MISFLEEKQQEEWKECDPLLREIVQYIHDHLWPVDEPFVVVSVHRDPVENARAGAKTLIHVVGPPYRAVDIRDRDLTAMKVAEITIVVNKRWIYDPARTNLPVCYSEVHGTGPHIHVQTCPGKTRLVS